MRGSGELRDSVPRARHPAGLRENKARDSSHKDRTERGREEGRRDRARAREQVETAAGMEPSRLTAGSRSTAPTGTASAGATSGFGESLAARGWRCSSTPGPAQPGTAQAVPPRVPQRPPARGAALPGCAPSRAGLPGCSRVPPLPVRAATHIVPLDEFDAFLQRFGDADGLELQSVHAGLCPGHLPRMDAPGTEPRSLGRAAGKG